MGNCPNLIPLQSVEELRQCILWKSLELENAKAMAQQELRMRDDQVVQLRGLLERTARERDEAREKYQKLLFENLLLQQQVAAAPPPVSGGSSVEDEPIRGEKDSPNTFNGGFSLSDCEDSIVSSPNIEPIQPPPSESLMRSLDSLLVPGNRLPEKGKLLQAVMRAGPLLQTLLLAGPLPQWQHPPPPLESSEIPPVKIPSPTLPPPPPPQPSASLCLQDSLESLLINTNISNNNAITSCGRVCNKRGRPGGLFDFPTETKYQRVALL